MLPTHRPANVRPPAARQASRLIVLSHTTVMACVFLALSTPPPTRAQSNAAPAPGPARYDIPPGPLDRVLNRFASTAGFLLAIDGALTTGKSSAGLSGTYGPREGLAAILAGSGLEAVAQPTGGYALRKAAPLAAQTAVPAPAPSPGPSTPVKTPAAETTLPAVQVRGRGERASDPLPRPYAGGQVARGGSVGLLGNQDIMETPFSMQSYTSELVRQLGARSPLELLVLDPSITRAIGVTEGSDQFTSRGFVQFGYRSYTVNGLSGIGASQGNDVELFERIDVIRGPTALVSGGAAALNVGATVNLVTKKAPDEPLLRLTSRFESRSLWTQQVDAGQRFGEDKAFGIRVNALHTGGHRNDDLRSGFERDLGGADFDYRGNRWRAYLHLFDLHYKTDPYGSVDPLTLDAPDPAKPPPRVIALGGNSNASRQSGQQAGVEWDVAADSTLALQYGRRTSASQQPYSYLQSLDPTSGDASQVNGYYGDRSHYKAYDATLRTRLTTGQVNHRLAFNASRSSNDAAYAAAGETAPFATNVYRQIAGPAAPRGDIGPTASTESIRSVGAVDTLGFFGDRLLLTVGVRRVSIDQAGDNDGDGVIETFYGKSRTTPGAGLLVKLSPSVSIYGNRVEAIEPGAQAPFNTGNPVDFVSNPGQIFGPIQSRQWELGAKWDLGQLALTAALYRIERPSFFTDAVTRFYGPQGQQVNRGFEFGFAGEPWRGVRLLGGYTYIDARLRATGDATTQNRIAIGVPKHTATLATEWDATAITGLTLVARLRVQSAQFADEINSTQAPGLLVGGVGANYRLPTRTPLFLRGFVDNVGDKRYYPSLSRGRLSQAAPRTVSLSLQADL